jgi:hypothetical protein
MKGRDMATTIQDLREWYNRGKNIGATHMVVVCDTYDREDYPCFVMPNQSVKQVAVEHHGPNMQKVMEVYNLSKSFENQDMVGRLAFDGWSPYAAH